MNDLYKHSHNVHIKIRSVGILYLHEKDTISNVHFKVIRRIFDPKLIDCELENVIPSMPFVLKKNR